MNLKQALKFKNKLTGQMNSEFQKVLKYNSVEENTIRPYSTRTSLVSWLQKSDELIELKVKIAKANVGVLEKIYTISELKNQIKLLKSVDCSQGITISRWDNSKPLVKDSELTVIYVDDLIKTIEDRIDILQDELDTWNYTTNI